MVGLLKNLFFTALIVAVATVASVTIGTVASLLLGDGSVVGSPAPPFAAIVFGLLIAVGLAMLTGMFFCLLTLFVAALTMPLAIWLARWLRLPRPATDVVGGVLAAWLCVGAGMEEADSLAQYGLTLSEPIFVGVGVLMGGLAGYARYRLLVRAHARPSLVAA